MNVTRRVLFNSSAFNTTEHKEYYINENCYGDDLCKWLVSKLYDLDRALKQEIGQEDFGWYFDFSAGDMDYRFILSYRPGEHVNEGDWIGCIERKSGVNALSFLFGASKRGIKYDAPSVIHSVLASSSMIQNIRWYTEEDFKNEVNAKAQPSQ